MKDKIICEFNQFLLENENKIMSECIVFLYDTYMDETYFEYIPSDEYSRDSSGEVRSTKTKNKDNITELFSDFLDFYTGEKTPSFESGHGWYFDTIETNLSYFIGELIFGEYLEKFVNPRIEEISKGFNIDSEISIICDFLIFEDVIGDCNIEIEAYIIDYLRISDWGLIDDIHNSIKK